MPHKFDFLCLFRETRGFLTFTREWETKVEKAGFFWLYCHSASFYKGIEGNYMMTNRIQHTTI